MKRIPIAAARRVAEEYGYDQVVIVGRKVGERGGEHVTTYGVNPANCDVAAHIGNYLKSVIMGWPGEVERLARRFLAWPLPESVRADPCTTEASPFPRYGTNLLGAAEAEQMVEYLLAPERPERAKPTT